MTRVADLLPEKPAKLLPEEVANRRANWLEVARMDVADAGRSWLLYTLCGLFVAVLLVAATVHVLDPPTVDGHVATLDFGLGLNPVVWVVRWLVPLTALLVGYGAVVGEREDGSLRVLLGLPITRRDVLIGKLLGRLAVFNAMLSIGLALAGAALSAFYVGFDPGSYAIFVALTLLLGSVFVGMGVGFSAFFRSRVRAAGASMSVFALLVFVWHLVSIGVSYLAHGRPITKGESAPRFIFYANANPTIGYGSFVEEWVTELGPVKRQHAGTSTYGDQFVGGVEPFYLQPSVLLVVLVLWGLVPMVVGAWRFSRSDVG